MSAPAFQDPYDDAAARAGPEHGGVGGDLLIMGWGGYPVQVGQFGAEQSDTLHIGGQVGG